MPRFLKKRTGTKGVKPGSLILVGQQKQEKVRIRVVSYDGMDVVEAECTTMQEAFSYIGKKEIAWINVDGLHDPEILWDIGKRFDVSELILEDFMNTDQRPAYHEEENQIFIIAKFLSLGQQQKNIESEQFSLIAGPGYLLTLQEREETYFDAVRQRIKKAPKRELLLNPDYLAYALLDCMVDNYMEIIAEVGEQVEKLDEEVISRPKKETVTRIYRLRTEMNFLRKNTFPIKEIAFDFLKSKSLLIHESTREFLNDLYDHVLVSGEALESYQLMIMDQMNMYNAGVSNRANEIMKTLTIFASLFIPLTFITGIYGMNFKFIPELSWKLGYLFFWIFSFLLGGGLLIYFRRKKWF